MILRNSLLQRQTTEHLVLKPLVSTHNPETKLYSGQILRAHLDEAEAILKGDECPTIDTLRQYPQGLFPGGS